MALLSALATEIAIPVCAVVGIALSLVPWWLGSRNSDNRDEQGDPNMRTHAENSTERRADEGPTERTAALGPAERTAALGPAERTAALDTHDKIKKDVFQGVKKFRSTGYRYVLVFTVAFVSLIFLILGSLQSFSTQSRPCKSDPSKKCKPALTTAFFTAVSFLLGAFTSVISGFLGMEIAIRANTRTALEERSPDGRDSIAALRFGAVMGFLPAGIGLLGLYIEINLFKLYYGNDWEGLFEAITGYGLGGSSMALFGRACGGIYAKAADVCLHLVIKNKPRCIRNERNPAVVTDYVGDIVGDIAGVGPDLFGSYAGSSSAALVVASVCSFGIKHDFTAMCYPLLISSMGILVGIFVCVVTILIGNSKHASKRRQLIISTILMTAGIVVISLIALPPSFTVYKVKSPEVVTQKVVKNWELSLCVAVGLWAGLIIEFVNGYDASDPNHIFSYLPDFVARNVSVGLGSVSIPLFAAFSISVSSHFAATYGIVVAALGMLSTISTRLAKDAYGPISDNAERIADMALVGAPDADDNMALVGAPDADDNPTVDITEGFAIELAALVSIALLGAFVSRPAILSPADVLTPKVIIGLIMGAWLPSYFSSMIMKRVGRAGFEMAREVDSQLRRHGSLIGISAPTDYDACFQIATDASFNGMIRPGALVMFAPFIVGTVFGVETLSGLLAGALGSVVQIAISASNSGGAWNQAKEDIRAGALAYAKTLDDDPEEENLRRLARKGKTTGHSRKDTSGPPLNILIQLMAVESLVLAPWFARHGDLLSKII